MNRKMRYPKLLLSVAVLMLLFLPYIQCEALIFKGGCINHQVMSTYNGYELLVMSVTGIVVVLSPVAIMYKSFCSDEDRWPAFFDTFFSASALFFMFQTIWWMRSRLAVPSCYTVFPGSTVKVTFLQGADDVLMSLVTIVCVTFLQDVTIFNLRKNQREYRIKGIDFILEGNEY